VKQTAIRYGKRIAIGALVVALGALGVVGGKRTIELIKTWCFDIFKGRIL